MLGNAHETLTVRAGETLVLDVAWQSLAHAEHDYSVFLHVARAQDEPPLAQSDALIRPDYPTLAWRAGEMRRDRLSVGLPADLPAGEYLLIGGVYFWKTGERLEVAEDTMRLPDARARLFRLIVR